MTDQDRRTAEKILRQLPKGAYDEMDCRTGATEHMISTIAAALAAQREQDANVVTALMGKDTGNWNRAMVYAAAAIRQGAPAQP